MQSVIAVVLSSVVLTDAADIVKTMNFTLECAWSPGSCSEQMQRWLFQEVKEGRFPTSSAASIFYWGTPQRHVRQCLGNWSAESGVGINPDAKLLYSKNCGSDWWSAFLQGFTCDAMADFFAVETLPLAIVAHLVEFGTTTMCALMYQWAYGYYHIQIAAFLYGHDLNDPLVEFAAVHGLAGTHAQDVVFLINAHYNKRQYIASIANYDLAQDLQYHLSTCEEAANHYAALSVQLTEEGAEQLRNSKAAEVASRAMSVVTGTARGVMMGYQAAATKSKNLASDVVRKFVSVCPPIPFREKFLAREGAVDGASECVEDMFNFIWTKCERGAKTVSQECQKLGQRLAAKAASMAEKAAGLVTSSGATEAYEKASRTVSEQWSLWAATMVPLFGSLLQGYLQASAVQQISDYAEEVFSLTYNASHPPFDPSQLTKPNISCAQGMGQCQLTSQCLAETDALEMIACMQKCKLRWCPVSAALVEQSFGQWAAVGAPAVLIVLGMMIIMAAARKRGYLRAHVPGPAEQPLLQL